MKNILNHDGTSQLLLSNVDDGSNRIVINDIEIPSSSWVGTGNYTQTISGTTIIITKVADLDGNVMLQLVSANTYRLVKYVKAEYLTTTGDTKDNVTTFQSSDTTDALATAWTSVTKLASGEKQSSIFAKMSQMFKNIRYLYKMLGTTDISQIGGGNVTGAISSLNTSLTNKSNVIVGTWTGNQGVSTIDLSIYQGRHCYLFKCSTSFGTILVVNASSAIMCRLNIASNGAMNGSYIELTGANYIFDVSPLPWYDYLVAFTDI